MKLAATVLVKNEADIIRQWFDYHLPRVDFVIVTDNGSTDGTREYLDSIRGPKVIVIDEPEGTYFQSEWCTRMTHFAAGMGADWVIPSDADEFWVSARDYKTEILQAAESIKPAVANALNCHWLVFHPTPEDDLSEKNPLIRLQWREQYAIGPHKVVHQTEHLKTVCQGNHGVVFDSDWAIKEAGLPGIRIFHYTFRSWEHFRFKVIQGGQAYEKHPVLGFGEHWRRMFGVWKTGGDAALRKLYDAEVLRPRDGWKWTGRGNPATNVSILPLVHDPTLARFFQDRKGEGRE
jgi:hypothetical protein